MAIMAFYLYMFPICIVFFLSGSFAPLCIHYSKKRFAFTFNIKFPNIFVVLGLRPTEGGLHQPRLALASTVGCSKWRESWINGNAVYLVLAKPMQPILVQQAHINPIKSHITSGGGSAHWNNLPKCCWRLSLVQVELSNYWNAFA